MLFVVVLLASTLAPPAFAQQAEPPAPLTGDAAIDAWVRTTFGQPVDPETLDDPISGTRTLLAPTAGQPAFKYGLTAEQIALIVDYLGTVERYEPAY